MAEGPIITGTLRIKDDTGKTLKSIQGNLTSVTKKIALAAAGLGVAMMAGIGAGIKIAADFEQQMIEVGKVIEGFDVHRGMLEDLAKTMSSKWAVGTAEVTRAMAFLGSMGKDAITVQQELNDVITMGIALNMDMEQAARLVASAQAIFSKETLSAAQVADRLNAITNKTAATTNFLSGALLMAGPAAAATGVNMNELLGVMTPLAAAGFQGSMAGRALNTIFPMLSRSAGDLQSGLSSLKSQGFDVNMAAMEGFADASPYDQIVALSKATKNLTQDQKREISEFIGGTQFFKQMFILLEDGAGILEGTSYAIDSMGSSQDEANKTTQSLNFRLAQMKQQILFMGMDIGERLLPQMEGFVDVLDSWSPSIKSAIDDVGEFASGIFDAAGAFAEGDWEKAGKLLSEAFTGIGDKIVEAIASVDWAPVFEGLVTVAGGLWDRVKEKIGDWGVKFKDALPKTPEEWDAAWAPLFTFAGTLWDKFRKEMGDVGTVFGAWLPATSEEWWNIWEGFKSFADTFWENFLGFAGDIASAFTTWVNEINWDSVFEGFGYWLADIGIWASGLIGSLDVALAQMLENTDWVTFLSNISSAIANAPLNIGKGIGKRIREWLFGTDLTSGIPTGIQPDGIEWGGAQASGGSGIVTRPTMFLAGEAGPEAYNFSPLGMGSQGGAAQSIHIGAIHIHAGDIGSEYGRGLVARDIVEQIGKEWMQKR